MHRVLLFIVPLAFCSVATAQSDDFELTEITEIFPDGQPDWLEEDYSWLDDPLFDIEEILNEPVSEDVIDEIADILNEPAVDDPDWWEDPLNATIIDTILPIIVTPVVTEIEDLINDISDDIGYPIDLDIDEVPLLPIEDPFDIGIIHVDEIEISLDLDDDNNIDGISIDIEISY